MSRLFLDTNVPTYAAGREHPLKEPCKEILGLTASHPGTFYTNAEVLQEMLHRYLSLKRWSEGKRTIADFATVMRGAVEAVHAEDVVLASELIDSLESCSKLPARDFLHVAVMRRTGSNRIVSADRDFDEFAKEGIERLDPAEVKHWRTKITDTGPGLSKWRVGCKIAFVERCNSIVHFTMSPPSRAMYTRSRRKGLW